MEYITEIIKGIIIGLANIIPGVSGGTIAVTMGVYDKIILAINNLKNNFLKSLKIILPYLIGAVIGIGGLSFLIKFALDKYAVETSFLFIGLIVGGIPLIFNKTKGGNKKLVKIGLFILFFLIISSFTFINFNKALVTDININLFNIIILMLVGMVASATMIIPGVSGSLVMMMLGYYGIIISNISNFISALLTFDTKILIHTISVLIPFGIGIIIGIALISKLLGVLFNKFSQLTYSAILGLSLGSPIPIIYNFIGYKIDFIKVFISIITFTFGIFLTYLLQKESR